VANMDGDGIAVNRSRHQDRERYPDLQITAMGGIGAMGGFTHRKPRPNADVYGTWGRRFGAGKKLGFIVGGQYSSMAPAITTSSHRTRPPSQTVKTYPGTTDRISAPTFSTVPLWIWRNPRLPHQARSTIFFPLFSIPFYATAATNPFTAFSTIRRGIQTVTVATEAIVVDVPAPPTDNDRPCNTPPTYYKPA